MSLFSKGKKAAKFTFISMPLSLIGYNQLKMGNQQIKALWRSNFSPLCPDCDQGVLCRQDTATQEIEQLGDGSNKVHYPWVCSHCNFGFLEVDDVRAVKAAASRYRNERVKAELGEIGYQEIQSIANSHKMHSRAFFISAMLGFLGFLYVLASDTSFIVALNWLSISFALWVFAMKKSYRHWQVISGQLFVEGSFWFWFQNEKWIK